MAFEGYQFKGGVWSGFYVIGLFFTDEACTGKKEREIRIKKKKKNIYKKKLWKKTKKKEKKKKKKKTERS